MTSTLAGFALFALLVTMAPGPDTLLVVRNCTRGGRLPGVATALGAAAGSLAWAAAAAIGLAAVLQRWDAAYTAVRLAGAVYLVVLGVQSLWAYRGGSAGGPPSPAQPSEAALPGGPAFRQGLLSCLLNPKVGTFFVAVVPQFLPHDHSTLPVILAFGAIDAVIAAGWLTLVTVFASRMMTWLRRPRVNRALEWASAGVLVALGLGSAVETV
ncbi:LysE family translocator [Streptomyces sp. NPDC059740]|uniref:LysE family translocator n=1 Tax=Streptomyces sp. NPDC059740 TaxID=3346926 RepID=UPI00365BA2AF